MTENIVTEKRCPKCKTVKPLAEFGKNRSRPDGLTPECRMCAREAERRSRDRYRGMAKPKKDEKRCYRCKQIRPITCFGNDNGRRDGKSPDCNDCRHERWLGYGKTEAGKAVAKRADRRYKDRLKGTPESKLRNRKQNLKKNHNLTIDEYEKIFASQEGRCAICRRETEKPLCVDHDHKTGIIRGLLCNNCNRTLGVWRDSPETAQRAVDYLLRHRQLRLVV